MSTKRPVVEESDHVRKVCKQAEPIVVPWQEYWDRRWEHEQHVKREVLAELEREGKDTSLETFRRRLEEPGVEDALRYRIRALSIMCAQSRLTMCTCEAELD